MCALSYSADKMHVPYYIVICGFYVTVHIFFHIISQMARFSGKMLVNIKCFDFLYNFRPKIFQF